MQPLRPIRRLLLIYPPDRALAGYFRANVPPLGVASLAAFVRDRCEVAVLDAKAEGYDNVWRDGAFEVYGLSPEEIEARIREYKPDAVGITCLASCNWPEVKAVAARAKNVDAEILTIAGGTHPSFLAESCLREEPALDVIARGEGEQILAHLIQASREGRGLHEVAGIAFRDNGEVVVRPFGPSLPDLDLLPFPSRDLLPMELYFRTRAPFSRLYLYERNTSIQTSRGCPAHCTFCSSSRFWGHIYRGQSAERVLTEMEHLRLRYGVRELQFIDDNLIYDRERARAIFEGMINRRLDFHWCMPNGVALWRLDVELLQLMRRAGCYSLTLAFESGNQEVLSRVIKKPVNLEKAAPLVAEMRRLGMQVHAFFISGFPGERLADMHDTYHLAQSLELDGAYFFIATPLPGTELCEKGQAEGYLPAELDFSRIEYNKGCFSTPEWSAKEVERLTGRFYLRLLARAFLRHPFRFLRNYGRVIWSRPRYTFSHLAAGVRRWRGAQAEGRG